MVLLTDLRVLLMPCFMVSWKWQVPSSGKGKRTGGKFPVWLISCMANFWRKWVGKENSDQGKKCKLGSQNKRVHVCSAAHLCPALLRPHGQ